MGKNLLVGEAEMSPLRRKAASGRHDEIPCHLDRSGAEWRDLSLANQMVL